MSEVMEAISCNGYARGSVTLPMECGPASRMFAFWLQMLRPGTPLSHPLSGLQLGLLKQGKKAGKQRIKMGKR